MPTLGPGRLWTSCSTSQLYADSSLSQMAEEQREEPHLLPAVCQEVCDPGFRGPLRVTQDSGDPFRWPRLQVTQDSSDHFRWACYHRGITPIKEVGGKPLQGWLRYPSLSTKIQWSTGSEAALRSKSTNTKHMLLYHWKAVSVECTGESQIVTCWRHHLLSNNLEMGL